MINTGDFENCVCRGRGNPHNLCDGPLTFQEKGKKVKLTPKIGEEARAIVLDGCVCDDDKPRCDGLFLFRNNQKRAIVLVELKGVHIDQAFEQLAWTRYHRKEYREIRELFTKNAPAKELAFVVSNYIPTKRELIHLEKENKIRVKQILHSEATKPLPELRKHL